MDKLIKQLAELAQACHKIDVKPIICGGLGVYLSYCGKKSEISNMIRVTQDIDLMLCRQDLLAESKRRALAEVITVELGYEVEQDKKHFGFKRGDNQELDILVPDVKELPHRYYRLIIERSILHGHITEEAEYIDEDLRAVDLSKLASGVDEECVLYVPSPTNIMIMKLFAFKDRNQVRRYNSNRAMAHAWDVFVVISLSDINDLRNGQDFLARHSDSAIIVGAKEIVGKSFGDSAGEGWRMLLGNQNFYPGYGISEKVERLEHASARIRRWFGV